MAMVAMQSSHIQLDLQPGWFAWPENHLLTDGGFALI